MNADLVPCTYIEEANRLGFLTLIKRQYLLSVLTDMMNKLLTPIYKVV
jgi:hypothetical protein